VAQLSEGVVRDSGPPPPGIDPENAKSPAQRGFSRCAEEDSNLHPVTRTRPSRRWALDRGVVLRTAASFLSAMENTLDTLDGVDVVRGVVAIRDQGVDKAGVLRSDLDARNSRRGDCGFDAVENAMLSQERPDVATARCQARLVCFTAAPAYALLRVSSLLGQRSSREDVARRVLRCCAAAAP